MTLFYNHLPKHVLFKSPGEMQRRKAELGSHSWMDSNCFVAELLLNSCLSGTVFVTLFYDYLPKDVLFMSPGEVKLGSHSCMDCLVAELLFNICFSDTVLVTVTHSQGFKILLSFFCLWGLESKVTLTQYIPCALHSLHHTFLNRVHCACSGPSPFNLFFLSFVFCFDWAEVLWP